MRENPRRLLMPILILCLSALIAACSYNDSGTDDSGTGVIMDTGTGYYPDWTETTHGNGTEPDYETVLPQEVVARLDIVLEAVNWQAMLDDMTDRYGPLGGGGIRPNASSDENPIWAPCSVFLEGTEWYQVGIRFKGNSSLQSAWRMGILKLPLKLDFDQYEGTFPELEDQRFYGFRQLSLSNAYKDESLIREKVASDVFRDAGVPAARTAFYRIYIDTGDGPEYFGLYTMVEVVDDTMVEDQFAEDGGNLYKPDGTGASFANGSFSELDFEKKSNELAADWSDIEAVFAAVHASTRTSNAAAWRAGLEAVLDVDGFLNWLAVNTVIQNWDTYGNMTHNYYLYNDPSSGLLSWIPWDNNEALMEGKVPGALPLDFTDVDSRWPLIRYLYDDEVYRARYADYVQAVIDETFFSARMVPLYQEAASLIEPYVVGADGERAGYTFLGSPGAFTAAQAYLAAHVAEREDLAADYVLEQQ